MTALIVLASALLLLAGMVLIVVWGGTPVRPPAGHLGAVDPSDRSEGQNRALQRYLWWANLWCFTAAVSALLVAWPGGRLVMRALAMTSPASAQGQKTEAQAIVGFPTLQGTLELLLFGGLPAGFTAALTFLLIHRWLPAGRSGGPLAGLIGLVVLGAFVEPFRVNNIDFGIVGPGWLSVVLFASLAVMTGALVAAAAGWYRQRLPMPSRQAWKAYLPLVTSLVFPPAAILIAAGALVVIIWSAIVPRPHSWASRRYKWAGRALLGLAMLSALPSFIGSIQFIVAGDDGSSGLDLGWERPRLRFALRPLLRKGGVTGIQHPAQARAPNNLRAGTDASPAPPMGRRPKRSLSADCHGHPDRLQQV